MKTVLILFLLLSVTTLAGEGKSLMKYDFKSDKVDSTVPKGKCLVIGKVKVGNDPLAEGVVSTIKHKYSAVTDSDGNYRLLIPEQKVMLYFFKPQYGEIVTHEYDFKSGHLVELDFYAYEDIEMLEVDKPVIYMYSPEKRDVSVEIIAKGEVTFTYPAYKKGWNFSVESSGTITKIENSKTYPYLFWEGKQSGLYYRDLNGKIYGDLVSNKEVVPFLEGKLSDLGLNSKEQTDFITFWAPKMIQHENMLIQFIVDEQYEKAISELVISPKPDAIRRVYMLFAKVENTEEIEVMPPPKEKEFKREGFTIIEWGGSEIHYATYLVNNK